MYAFILLLTSILRLFGKDPKDPVPSLRSSGNVLNSFNCKKKFLWLYRLSKKRLHGK